jgi:hypothetical protein
MGHLAERFVDRRASTDLHFVFGTRGRLNQGHGEESGAVGAGAGEGF